MYGSILYYAFRCCGMKTFNILVLSYLKQGEVKLMKIIQAIMNSL